MRWIFYLTLLCFGSVYAGEILTTSAFEQIECEVNRLSSHSLVLFDVDGTLIVPEDAILKPKEKRLFKLLIADYSDRDLFREIRLKAPHSLVDCRLNFLVQRLQEKNVPVLAFTAAPAKINDREEPGDWRVNELLRYDFDFQAAFPDKIILEFPEYSNLNNFPIFKSGVLFSSFHPKGEILLMFLELMNFYPDKVVFIDDELEHVQNVVSSLEKYGIPCLGIHYTSAEQAPCNVDINQAQFQIDYFIQYDVWLSDIMSKEFLIYVN